MFGRAELWIYLLTSRIVGKRLIQKLKARSQQVGIPDDRFSERLGLATVPKKAGRLIWLHTHDAISAVPLFSLIGQLNQQDLNLHFLVTTHKQEKVDVLLDQLPEYTTHQYLPIDLDRPIEAFLKHWAPDVVVISESEFWPRFLTRIDIRKIPLIAINTRITNKSYRRWRWLPGLTGFILNRFDLILAQDQTVAKKLKRLGVESGKIRVTGLLAETKKLLQYDESLYANLSAAFGSRSVWLSANTHRDEEDVVVNAHKIAMRRNRRLLLILHAREKDRGARIAARHENQNLTFALQQNSEIPDDATDVYITEKLENLATYMRLASVSFCGGTLSKGQAIDPFHPASMGSAIIHGPACGALLQDYNRYREAGAAQLVSNGSELAQTLNTVLAPNEAALMAHAAWEISSEGGEVSSIIIAEILEKLTEGKPVNAAA